MTKYKSNNDALIALVEAQKLIGKKGVIMPEEGASADDWNEFYNKLGRPEKPDDYELPEIKDFPDDLPVQEAMVKDYREIAHTLGLSNKQTSQLYEWYQKQNATVYNNLVSQKADNLKSTETSLRKEWGKAYDEKVSSAKKMLEFVSDNDLGFFEEHGNNPSLIRTLSNIAAKMSEDTLGGRSKGLTMTPDEARQEIIKIKSDVKHPFNIEDHPERAMAISRMNDLYKMAYPDLAENA